MADGSSSCLSNKWRHYDITAFVEDHLCVSQLPWFIWVLSLSFSRFNVYVYFEGNLDSANKFNNMTSSWRYFTSLCQSSYAQKLEMMSILLPVILVAVGWGIFKLHRGRPRINILIIVDRTKMSFKLRLKRLSHCQENYAVHYFWKSMFEVRWSPPNHSPTYNAWKRCCFFSTTLLFIVACSLGWTCRLSLIRIMGIQWPKG